MKLKQKGDEIVVDRQVAAQEREVKAAVTPRMGKAEERNGRNPNGETSVMPKWIKCGVRQALLTLAQHQAEEEIGRKMSTEAENKKRWLKNTWMSQIQNQTMKEGDLTEGEKDLDLKEYWNRNHLLLFSKDWARGEEDGDSPTTRSGCATIGTCRRI